MTKKEKFCIKARKINKNNIKHKDKLKQAPNTYYYIIKITKYIYQQKFL